MSDSLSDAAKAIVGALVDTLSVPHTGIKLPRVLIAPLATYLHATLKMEDPEEVEDMGKGAFLAAVTECGAFRGEVPESINITAEDWYESEVGPKIVKKSPPTSTPSVEMDDVGVPPPLPRSAHGRRQDCQMKKKQTSRPWGSQVAWRLSASRYLLRLVRCTPLMR